jgi:hypothetical protein
VAGRRGFLLTNRVANPVLRRVLKTRAGRRLGRRLAVVRYRGSRTGRPHELVVQYARTDAAAWVLVGRHEVKTWWHNLRTPAEVELWLAGEPVRARAVAVLGSEQPDECRRGLLAYVAQVSAARRALGLPADPGRAEVDASLPHVVMVRADLAPRPTDAA